MFAIVKTGGKQYKVQSNDVLRIEKVEGKAGDTVILDNVLLIDDGKSVKTASKDVEAKKAAAPKKEAKAETKKVASKKATAKTTTKASKKK